METETQGILDLFRRLNRFPHASWQEEAVSGALAQALEARGYMPVRDQWHNLRCDLPATPGCEAAPLLILQGHLDMVCAVKPGSGFDPLRDTVNIKTDGGFLRSDGRSSLGADNNLGNAAALWVLAQGVRHGPIRLLFTVAEEVGLQGAARMDPHWLDGASCLLNTDGFKLGRLVVSSAGGRRETYTKPLELTPTQNQTAWAVTIEGGTGGHSGEDIHRGRANAVKLMAELLSGLWETSFELADLSGGSAHNAIPASARSVVVLKEGGENELLALADRLREAWQTQFVETEPHLRLRCAPTERPEAVWSQDCRDTALEFLQALFSGVYARHRWASGVTGASANLGKVGVEDGQITVAAFLRAAEVADTAALSALQGRAAEQTGFRLAVNAYPGWPGNPDSPLAQIMAGVFRRETGKEADITAVHVGLEPSIFYQSHPELDIVSTGPDILDAHSVDERAPLDSLPAYAHLLAGTLEAVALQR